MNVYIFDLDGTLADGRDRLHHIQQSPKNWESYFAECFHDRPISSTIELSRLLKKSGCQIYIWTGRNASTLEATKRWLLMHGVHWDQLLMREESDRRQDHEIKREWYESLVNRAKNVKVLGVFEDRDRVVSMWRSLGLTCYQVGPGDF